MVRYSNAWYHVLVFRPPFEYWSAIQMPSTLGAGIWTANHLNWEQVEVHYSDVCYSDLHCFRVSGFVIITVILPGQVVDILSFVYDARFWREETNSRSENLKGYIFALDSSELNDNFSQLFSTSSTTTQRVKYIRAGSCDIIVNNRFPKIYRIFLV